MSMSRKHIIKTAYYILVGTFYLIFFCTNIGNYFHGGTPLGLVALQAIAVVISLMAVKLFSKVQIVEKIVIICCALLPLSFLIFSVFSLFEK